MERTSVNSSNINSIGYDSESEVLEVEFSNGAIWQYSGVSADTFSSLQEAESVGKYFASHIKNNYTATRV